MRITERNRNKYFKQQIYEKKIQNKINNNNNFNIEIE